MLDKNLEVISNITVIYLDDNKERRKKYTDIFFKIFSNVLIAGNCEELLQLYEKNQEYINIVILNIDNNLKEKVNALKTIKLLNEEIKIVVLSNKNIHENILSVINIGIEKILLDNIDEKKLFKEFFKISEQIKTNNELKQNKDSYIDSVTRLPKRLTLVNDLVGYKNEALIIINIDSFRDINEYYGYKTGDFISLEMKKRLSEFIVEDHFKLYKLQVDEYAILIKKHIVMLDFENLAIKIYNKISEEHYNYNGVLINITASIGIAIHDEDTTDLAKNADLALVHAKKFGKSYVIYNRYLKDISFEKHNWTNILKEAIKNDRILVYYQAIMDNKDNKINKYEALIRLQDSEGNIHPPIAFLDVAKQAKIYTELTKIVISKTFAKFNNLDYTVSINLSIEDMLNPDIKSFILDMLDKYPNLRNRVVFEILESEGISNYDNIIQFIDDLKQNGCEFAMDDFGSGYANFFNLVKLKVDFIKIDGTIIKNIDKDENAQIITKAIVKLAKELGIKIVAEFVHKEEILDLVKKLKINYSQGYYIKQPLPEEEII